MVFYRFYFQKEEEKKGKLITAYDYLDEALVLGIGWHIEAQLIGISAYELRGSSDYLFGP